MKGYRRKVKRSADDLEAWGRGGALSILGSGHAWGFLSPSPVGPYDKKFDWDTCRKAWEYWRERLIQRFIETEPCERPWAYWIFDVGKKHEPTREQQARYLKRHGLLTDREKEILKRREREAAEHKRQMQESDERIRRANSERLH